jgi:hypothetical protein
MIRSGLGSLLDFIRKMAVSLTGYDPENVDRALVNTPHSIEACRRIGCLPPDLL